MRLAAERDGDNVWVTALRFSTVGIEFGVGPAIGYFAGRWLDSRFGTQPYLTVLLALLGIAAAFASLFRRVREVQRQQRDEDEDERRG